MNFTAIDFETANGNRNSACSLGLVRVEDGKIIQRKEWLVSPPEMYFHPINVSIHGITQKDVWDKPEFNYIWEEVEGYLHGNLVIAHNASFDISVLKACLETYRIHKPDFNFFCTVQISRNVWPNLENHRLNTLANKFNIPLNHHNALEDTLACAKIAMFACQEMNVNNLIELTAKIGIMPGELHHNSYKAPKKLNNVKSEFRSEKFS